MLLNAGISFPWKYVSGIQISIEDPPYFGYKLRRQYDVGAPTVQNPVLFKFSIEP